MMKLDKFLLLKNLKIFAKVAGSAIATTLDLTSWYWQIYLSENCKETLTFVCRSSTVQFEVLANEVI